MIETFRQGAETSEGWERVVRRCRREMDRAGRIVRSRLAADDQKLLVWAADADKDRKTKAASRIQGLWRAVGTARQSIGMTALHPEEDLSKLA